MSGLEMHEEIPTQEIMSRLTRGMMIPFGTFRKYQMGYTVYTF